MGISISRNITIDNKKLKVTTSIGVALFPEDGQDIDTLLKNADNAMYQAKLKGKNNFQLYSKNIHNIYIEKIVTTPCVY